MDIANEILVLDDDLVMREMIALWLAGAGFDVYHPRGVLQGLRIKYPQTLRCIVADLNARDIETSDLLQQLRERYPSAFIVAISGYFQLGAGTGAELARQLGVARVLAKPFTCDQLIAAVNAKLPALLQDIDIPRTPADLRERLAARTRCEPHASDAS
jgi:DNA-binding NtrC family response regulator